MTSNADIARAMAENMAKAAVPLYGKKMRLPDRVTVTVSTSSRVSQS